MIEILINTPVYFYTGVLFVWDGLLLIPHPSWHKLVEAFVTGVIIKCGYWVAHRIISMYEGTKKQKTGKGVAAASGMAEYLEN